MPFTNTGAHKLSRRRFQKRFKSLGTSATLAVSSPARGSSFPSSAVRNCSWAFDSLSKRLDFAAPATKEGAVPSGLAVADGRPTPTDVLWEIKRATSLVSSRAPILSSVSAYATDRVIPFDHSLRISRARESSSSPRQRPRSPWRKDVRRPGTIERGSRHHIRRLRSFGRKLVCQSASPSFGIS